MRHRNNGCGAHIAWAAVIALLVIALSSCWTPKRCNRALLKCGVVSDTVQVWDSLYIERSITDTLLRWDSLRLHDTVTIERDRVRIKLVKLPAGKIYVQGECKDTVIRYVRQVVKHVQRPPFMTYWRAWLAMLIGGIGVGAYFFGGLRK